MQFQITTTLVAALWTVGTIVITGLTSGVHAAHIKGDLRLSGHAAASMTHKGGMVLIEDDIFVGRTDRSHPTLQSRGISLSNPLSLWVDGIVPYEIDASVTALGRQSIEAAIAHWNLFSSISLVDTQSTDETEPDYIRFINGPGCASWVGRQGGAQEIWVSDYCTSGSMIHEIGHALGLLHEHTRADRDQYIEVRWGNVQSDKMFNFEISNSGTTDLGAYDYNSVMHYGEYFFSSNGEKTLVPVQEVVDAVIGQRVAASAGDLAAIDSLYQTDLALSSQTFDNNGTPEIRFSVNNLGDRGAHNLVLTVDGAGSEFNGDAGWECSAANGQTRCTLARLAARAAAQVTVHFSAGETLGNMSGELSSRTHDANPANNRSDSTTTVDPIVDPAPDPASDPVLAAAGNGEERVNLSDATGTFSLWLLLVLLPLCVLRRRPVLACDSAIPRRADTHASIDSATPSGRTRR